MFTSDRTVKWIENLAEQERLISVGQKASIDLTNAKEEVLDGETSAFVRDLFTHFQYLVSLFNAKIQPHSGQIKMEWLSSKQDQFQLVRHAMKLSLSRKQPGTIHVQCDKALVDDGLGSPRSTVMFSATIEAGFGVFHDVQWNFLGSPITAEQVARHYLTEFIQTSRLV